MSSASSKPKNRRKSITLLNGRRVVIEDGKIIKVIEGKRLVHVEMGEWTSALDDLKAELRSKDSVWIAKGDEIEIQKGQKVTVTPGKKLVIHGSLVIEDGGELELHGWVANEGLMLNQGLVNIMTPGVYQNTGLLENEGRIFNRGNLMNNEGKIINQGTITNDGIFDLKGGIEQTHTGTIDVRPFIEEECHAAVMTGFHPGSLGSCLEVKDARTLIYKPSSGDPMRDDLNGVAFGNAPIADFEEGLYFEVRVDDIRSGHNDGLTVGVTATPPWQIVTKPETADSVPMTWLAGFDGYCWNPEKQEMLASEWEPSRLHKGDAVGVLVTYDGDLVVTLGGRIVAEMEDCIPVEKFDLYAVVNLLGNTIQVSLDTDAHPDGSSIRAQLPRGKPKVERIDRDSPIDDLKILRAPTLMSKLDMQNKKAASAPWWMKLSGVVDDEPGLRKTREVPVSVREKVIERRTAALEAEESALKQAPDDEWARENERRRQQSASNTPVKQGGASPQRMTATGRRKSSRGSAPSPSSDSEQSD